MIGLVVGCFIGALLIALIVTGHDGETFAKNIDIFDDFDAAKGAFGAQMAYGYENPSHANVDFVSCQITDTSGHIMEPYNDTWNKPEPEPVEE